MDGGKGVGRKIFRGEGGNEKRSKNIKIIPKNSTIKPLPGGSSGKKAARKIAQKSLYLLYL